MDDDGETLKRNLQWVIRQDPDFLAWLLDRGAPWGKLSLVNRYGIISSALQEGNRPVTEALLELLPQAQTVPSFLRTRLW